MRVKVNRSGLRRGVSLFTIVAVLLALMPPTAVRAKERVQLATVLRADGDVSVKPPGEETFRILHERERLRPGTVIRTGKRSRVVLRLSEKNVVSLAPETEFEIERAEKITRPGAKIGIFSTKKTDYRYSMKLEKGEAVSILKGMGRNSDYKVNTPVAVAGVRGTVFSVRLVEKEGGVGGGGTSAAKEPVTLGQFPAGGALMRFECTVLEGQVSVDPTGPAAATLVNAGQTFRMEAMVQGRGHRGAGNRGRGFGNTGRGNRGRGPNQATAGNAGGEGGGATAEGGGGGEGEGTGGGEGGGEGVLTGGEGAEGGGEGGEGAGGEGAGAGEITILSEQTLEGGGDLTPGGEAPLVQQPGIMAENNVELQRVQDVLVQPVVAAEFQVQIGIGVKGICE